jgi:hypothetical protein
VLLSEENARISLQKARTNAQFCSLNRGLDAVPVIHGNVSSSICRFVVGAKVGMPPSDAYLIGETAGLQIQVAEPKVLVWAVMLKLAEDEETVTDHV